MGGAVGILEEVTGWCRAASGWEGDEGAEINPPHRI